MDRSYALLRHKPGQALQVLFPAPEPGSKKVPVHLSQDLLRFIEIHAKQTQVSQNALQKEYTEGGQFFLIHFIPEQDQPSNAQHVVILVQAAEQIHLQEGALSSLIADLKLFFRKGAHDIKNLFSNLSLLLQANMGEKAEVYLTELQEYYLKQIDHFYEALDTFVSTHKPDAPQVREISLQPLITDILSPYSSLPDITMETDFEECPGLTYREDHLRNMLKSLIDNAIRYRDEKRKLVIQMKTEKIADQIIFSIEDNGIGIDMDRYEEKLFMPFQRFTRQSSGQGISLHLVKMMVEKNGGSIHLRSTLQQGTRVILTLKEYAD